jgi:hypothetical protein
MSLFCWNGLNHLIIEYDIEYMQGMWVCIYKLSLRAYEKLMIQETQIKLNVDTLLPKLQYMLLMDLFLVNQL